MTAGMLVLLMVLLFLATLVGLLIWYVSRATSPQYTCGNLAAVLGWTVITPHRSPRDTWMGGLAQGRAAAMTMVVLPDRNASKAHNNASKAHNHGLWLRVVMHVVTPQPLGIHVLRDRQNANPVEHFEGTFSVENAQRIGPAARNTMLQFVRHGYGTGLQGDSYRSNPGTRNLLVCNRISAAAKMMDEAVLPQASTILMVDWPNPQISAADFNKLLFEMATVAYALEQGG